MSKQGLYIGKRGEEAAARLLKRSGYRILLKNYRTKSGEIDIIADDKGTICFIEVKARKSERFGSPYEAIPLSKQKKISKTALTFLKERGLLNKRARFDVISVVYDRNEPRLELIKDAFELSNEFIF
ncbi:MAG: YraN family protein [Candidatus Omnitrophota bacterium]